MEGFCECSPVRLRACALCAQVQIVECSVGNGRGWADGGNVDCGTIEDFLKSFREKAGKSGIASICARLNRVKMGRDEKTDSVSKLPAALVVFIIHRRLGKRGRTTGLVSFRG